MTSLLSAIPGQFGKSLVLGALLPAAIFVILVLVFVVPIYVDGLALFEPLQVIQPQWQALTMLFLTVVLTGLLYNLNTPVVRFYEGYPWQDSVLGKWRIEHYEKRFDAAQARLAGMYTLRKWKGDAARQAEVRTMWSKTRMLLLNEFPDRRSLILPTRLGNVIRSSERYPSVQYNIDAIALWGRLTAVLGKEYTAAIDDARISMNFMLNSSLLSVIMALAIVVAGLLYPPRPVWLRVALPALVFAVLSVVFYLLSIGRARAWGDLIRGAFDLYRWDLLKKMGYEQKPETRAEERILWGNITRQIIFADRQRPAGEWEPRVDYTEKAPKPSPARATPEGVRLEVARGVLVQDGQGALTVVWGLRNVDAKGREAEGLILTDRVADGFDYEWGSVRADGWPVRVVGTNPYEFHVDAILPGQSELVLTYRTIPRKDG